MGEPFIGEVKLISFSYAPHNWAYCDGQDLPINQNTTLYSLLGSQFGGDDRTFFKLPDLRGRAPAHPDGGLYRQGWYYGFESVTLNQTELPQHTHSLYGTTTDGTTNRPDPTGTRTFASSTLFGSGTPFDVYRMATNLTQLNPASCSATGGSQGHDNLQPSLVVGFIIALQGAYPSRN